MVKNSFSTGRAEAASMQRKDSYQVNPEMLQRGTCSTAAEERE
jgi:hypothetical protein